MTNKSIVVFDRIMINALPLFHETNIYPNLQYQMISYLRSADSGNSSLHTLTFATPFSAKQRGTIYWSLNPKGLSYYLQSNSTISSIFCSPIPSKLTN